MDASALRGAAADAVATPDLRRLQAAWGTSAIGAWVFFIALAVYAYDIGGAVGVGLAALVRMLPAGLAAPLAGLVVDRRSRRDVLLVVLAARAVVLGAIAAAIAGGAAFAVVLALAAAFTILTTAHRPAQAALLPSLAETPRQLAAANAIWSGTDNAAFLVGSLAGGALIATAGVEWAFAVTAVLFAVAVVPMARIPRDAVPAHRSAPSGAGVTADVLSGVRAIVADDALRVVVGFLTLATVVEGAADVLVVVLALEILDAEEAAVGWLNACWGIGGLVGGAAALALLGRGRLAAGLAAGGLFVGLSLSAIAAIPLAAAAAVFLVVLGVGYALIEVAGLSLLQRLSSDEVLGRAFAVVESGYWVATGVGAMLAPLLVSLFGARGALLAVGACLPVLVALRWAALARLEAGVPVPEAPFRALRGVGIFAALPLATVEDVSRRLEEVSVEAGAVIMREGDSGDRFYVIAEGASDVDHDGHHVHTCGPGDVIGEIALLRDCPRTATVTAQTDSVLYALRRDAFLNAMGACPRWSSAVEEAAEVRLEEQAAL